MAENPSENYKKLTLILNIFIPKSKQRTLQRAADGQGYSQGQSKSPRLSPTWQDSLARSCEEGRERVSGEDARLELIELKISN